MIWLAPRVGKMNQILHGNWLPKWARRSYMYLAHSLCPARKIYMKTIPINKSINPLLTKLVWSRWLDMGQVLFFVVAILWTSAQSAFINNDEKKKNLANITLGQ